MIRVAFLVTGIALLGGSAIAGEKGIKIRNPAKTGGTLVVEVYAPKHKRLVWKPVSRGLDKSRQIEWYEAYSIPDHRAFLLLKHKTVYEDDLVFPTVYYFDGRTTMLQTKGIPGNNGLRYFLTGDRKNIHIEEPNLESRMKAEGLISTSWDKEYYDLSSGARVEMSSIAQLRPYIAISGK